MIAEKPNQDILIHYFENSEADGKALDNAVKQFKALSPETSCLFFSVDKVNSKILCLALVPNSAVKRGLKANEWVSQIQGLMKGKGGGKPNSAQSNGTNIECLTEAMEKAKEYALTTLKEA